jgi:hypothetical protein
VIVRWVPYLSTGYCNGGVDEQDGDIAQVAVAFLLACALHQACNRRKRRIGDFASWT